MILIAGQIESLATRKDKTIKLTIGTQELSPKQASDIFQLNQQFVFIGLKPEPFHKIEEDIIDNLKTDYENLKTPSQRLRGVLYRNFEQQDEGYKDFNSYYIAKMELICNHYKSKLEETY
jgi:hypothetical protein